MSARSRKWLFQGASLGVAGILLYLALRNVDISRVGSDMANGVYIWVLPLIAITITSHLIRAWRWTLLLNVLPEQVEEMDRVTISSAFKSLMIGYMTNYAAPRLGEVVRTGHLAARTNSSFSAIFGTVIAERILDVLSLGLAFLSLPLLLGPNLNEIISQLLRDGGSLSEGTISVIVAVTVVIVIASLGFLTVQMRTRKQGRTTAMSGWISSVRVGMGSIIRTGKPGQLVLSTVLMWGCYALMSYWPLHIFRMTDQYGMSFADGWSLMILGAVGVLIPSPGGIGSYHYIAITALVTLWGVTQETAASYAIFTHGGQLILYVAIGFAVLIRDGASWSELKTARNKSNE